MGANVVNGMVTKVSWHDGRPTLGTRGEAATTYDLLVVATGLNSRILETMSRRIRMLDAELSRLMSVFGRGPGG